MSHADALSSSDDLSKWLELLVRRHAHGAGGFEQLVRRCQGAYPTDVQQAVLRLRTSDASSVPDAVLTSSPGTFGASDGYASILPVPHPLDFEWRFSANGCSALSDLIARDTNLSEPIALLGTPAFAEQLGKIDGRSSVTLFERRREACAALSGLAGLEVVEGDLSRSAEGHGGYFAAAVADPPWYPEVSEIFVRSAAHLLMDGGILLFCAPSLGTRPGLITEREQLLRVAADVGLVFEALLPDLVEYESPPFEQSALAAAGLKSYDRQWRRCDLMKFRRATSRHQAGSGRVGNPADGQDWSEVVVGQSRIRVDTSRRLGTRLLGSVVPGDVLDSVSSRDVRRRQVNVWTTTNRVFRTNEPSEVLNGLQAISESGLVNDKTSTVLGRLIIDEQKLLGQLGVKW